MPRPADPELLTDGSEPMAGLLRDLRWLAASTLPVLVLGPTGCGKELVARALHAGSGRAGPLLAVNCAALAEGTLESELFGHVRGAFTGAVRDRRGALACADGGTLFLDEVAELSPRLQSLLLRAIQEGEYRPVGGERTLRADARVVAATSRGLHGLAEAGGFRPDLLFRLQGALLQVPPLSARRHEFPYLVPRLLARIATRCGRPAPALEPGLAAALAALPWPGNVRQLLHALERGLLRCEDGVLARRHLQELQPAPAAVAPWAEATRAFQRQLLEDALRAHQGRVAEAARALGLARPSLYAVARRLGVSLQTS